MAGKRSRSIIGWRQVKPEQGAAGRRFFPGTAPKAAPRATPREATGSDRWESEGGTLVAPVVVSAAVPAAAIAAKKPKLPL